MTDADGTGLSRPVASYRLQFSSVFTFEQATAVAPYLAELGISHVYASPYLTARAGSTHGSTSSTTTR